MKGMYWQLGRLVSAGSRRLHAYVVLWESDALAGAVWIGKWPWRCSWLDTTISRTFAEGVTGVKGYDAGAIIRYSDGAAGPLRNRARRTGEAVQPLLSLMEDRTSATAATRRERSWAAPPQEDNSCGLTHDLAMTGP